MPDESGIGDGYKFVSNKISKSNYYNLASPTH